jgi:hypothetical protein
MTVARTGREGGSERASYEVAALPVFYEVFKTDIAR